MRDEETLKSAARSTLETTDDWGQVRQAVKDACGCGHFEANAAIWRLILDGEVRWHSDRRLSLTGRTPAADREEGETDPEAALIASWREVLARTQDMEAGLGEMEILHPHAYLSTIKGCLWRLLLNGDVRLTRDRRLVIRGGDTGAAPGETVASA